MYKTKLWLSWLVATSLLFTNVTYAAIGSLSIQDDTGGESVSITVTDPLTQSYTLTLPADVSAGIFKTNGTGTVSFGTLDTADITAGAITTTELGDNAVTNAKLADDAVTSVELAISDADPATNLTGAAEGDIAYDTTDDELQVYNGSAWVAMALDSEATYTAGTGLSLSSGEFSITAGGVSATELADDAVTTAKILDANVTEAKLAADAVTAAKLADDAVDTAAIVDANVTEAKLAADAVTAAKLADDAVDTAAIVDANVTEAKLAADAVTAAKLADDAVDTAAIVDANVTTAKIADNAVTTGKIDVSDADPATNLTGAEGDIAYDTTDDKLQYYNGSAWVDVASSSEASYTAGTGIDITTGTISFDGTWDEVSNGAGLYMDYRPNNTACTEGQVIEYDATNNRWGCADDDDTTYTAASPLTLTGSEFGVDMGLSDLNDVGTVTYTAGQILVADGDSYESVSASGDVTIASSGAITIANDAITTAKILDANVTTAKLADDAVTAAKLADDSVDAAAIINGAITFADLNAGAYVTSGIDSGTGGDLLVTEAAVEAYVGANGDDLGNHTATQILVMGANKIVNTDDANDYGIAIGANGSLTTDNALTVSAGGADITGDTAVTGNITATGTITSTSDIAFKENVETVANPIETLVALRGVQWDWKSDYVAGSGLDGDRTNYGVIAQELEKVLPAMVYTDEDGHKSVAYNQLTAFLIESGKAQQDEIESLQARLDRLETLLLNVASAQ